jgi:2-polyprenyl-3-methyl-5-hydroxy-6-metoxy-1,4-benzoquinol methylase
MSKFAGHKSSSAIKDVYLKSLGKHYGEFLLGENTTKILHTDPKLLLFTLSRYKFVSKMFSGFSNVLEIGCQEGFGAALVSMEVGLLHAIDFFIPYIESCDRRIRKKNIVFEKYDILDGPIEKGFDGIFALDVLEHIEKSEEDLFMRNVVRSMNKDGSLILGMPSLESQVYASEASKIGHVNCKSGKEIAEFAKKYFRNVFLFSMNDEVLHTGFSPMAHYLLVLCCNKNEI